MSNEAMCIFFPLKNISYPQVKYVLDYNQVDIILSEAVAYENLILAAITNENRLIENDRGPAGVRFVLRSIVTMNSI